MILQKQRSHGQPIRACTWASASCPSRVWAPTYLEDWLPAPGTRSYDTAAGLILVFLTPHICGSLANGSAALVAVGNTSRSEFIKHLKRYNSSSGQVRPGVRLYLWNIIEPFWKDYLLYFTFTSVFNSSRVFVHCCNDDQAGDLSTSPTSGYKSLQHRNIVFILHKTLYFHHSSLWTRLALPLIDQKHKLSS